jgi:hypothetical protein
MGHYRVKEELGRIQLGLRYVGLDIGQFYWQCLKLVAASEELTETDILRRIIRSWSETLPPAIRENARAETTRLEAWKAQELRTREKPSLKLKIQNGVDVFCSRDDDGVFRQDSVCIKSGATHGVTPAASRT